MVSTSSRTSCGGWWISGCTGVVGEGVGDQKLGVGDMRHDRVAPDVFTQCLADVDAGPVAGGHAAGADEQ